MSERSYRTTSRGGYPAPLRHIIEAQNVGANAVLENQPVSACPYLHDRSERGRFLAVMWHRGYRARQQQIADGD